MSSSPPQFDPADSDQGSLRDSPQPPRLVPSNEEVVVEIDGEVVARTTSAIRVLEAGHPPAWYIPPEDVRLDRIVPEASTTFCPWKGTAYAYGVRTDAGVRESAAWCYPEPSPGFEPIARYLAFYPSRADRCTVDGVEAQPAPSGDTGGWIIPDEVEPGMDDQETGA